MQFSNNAPGRTIGSVMVLQALVARLMATHPQRDDIMRSLENFSEGILAGASDHSRAGNEQAAEFMADIAGGMDDTMAQISDYLAMLDAGMGRLTTSTTLD